jgi:hypothetical protein
LHYKLTVEKDIKNNQLFRLIIAFKIIAIIIFIYIFAFIVRIVRIIVWSYNQLFVSFKTACWIEEKFCVGSGCDRYLFRSGENCMLLAESETKTVFFCGISIIRLPICYCIYSISGEYIFYSTLLYFSNEKKVNLVDGYALSSTS